MRVLIGILNNKIIAAVETRLFILLSLKKRSDCNCCCQLLLTGAAISIFIKTCLPRQNICHDKIMFVAAKCSAPTSHKLVATKMILLAAPANDTQLHFCWQCHPICDEQHSLVRDSAGSKTHTHHTNTHIHTNAHRRCCQLHFCWQLSSW